MALVRRSDLNRPLTHAEVDGNFTHLEGLTGVDSRPYKVYTATLTQSGTADPIPNILENGLGGDITWTRLGVGSYLGTLTGAFITNKTFLFAGSIPIMNRPVINFNKVNDNSVSLQLSVNDVMGDDLLQDFSVEIRVYN
jgi:hypothetical protein